MEMRFVMYRERIYDDKYSNYSKDYTKKGVFHQWATKTSGDSDRFDTEIYAIIENEDGTIETIPHWAIKFTYPKTSKI